MHLDSEDPFRPAVSRRRVLAAIAAAMGSAATPAAAQFQIPFGGTTVDVGKVFSGAKSLFEGFSLGEADEISLGTGLYPRLIERSGGTYRNRKVQSAVQRLAEPLLRSSPRGNLPWEIVVVDDATVNAWALPGGKLALNKGLLRFAAAEADLAAVIAHEVGHVEQSHALSEMRTKKFTEGVTSVGREVIASRMRSSPAGFLTDDVLDALEAPIYNMVTTGYSRSHEFDADLHILSVFERTGYDPAEAPNFFRTLLALIPPNAPGTTSLFSTHPGTAERVDALEVASAKLPRPAPRPPVQEFADLKRVFPTPRSYKGPA